MLGLGLTLSKPSGGGVKLGPNLFVGGDMDSDVGFTLQAGWSIAGGVGSAVATGSPTSLIKSSGGTNDTNYRLEFDMLNYVTGNLDVVVGTVNLADMAEDGHYSVDFTTDAGGNNVLFLQGYTLTADVDNISLREIL